MKKQLLLKMLKYMIALAISLLFLEETSAQSSQWVNIKDSSGVSFQYKSVICNNKPNVVLKVTNTNDNPVTIKWRLWGFGPDQGLVIPANQSIVGTCQSTDNLIQYIPVGTSEDSLIPNFLILSLIQN